MAWIEERKTSATASALVTTYWHSPVLPSADDDEGVGLSAEVSSALHAIMAISSGVNQERFEFLG